MLQIGCWTLSLWVGLNLLVSLKIIVETLCFGGHTPALTLLLDDAQVRQLSSETLATIDSIAVFANGLNVAFCSIALALIWGGIYQHMKGFLYALICGFLAAWLAGVGADWVIGNAALWVNAVSLAILACGILCSVIGLRTTRATDGEP